MAGPNRRRELNISLRFVSAIFTIALISIGCNHSDDSNIGFPAVQNSETGISIYGNTQGTTYAIMCNDRIKIEKSEIDNILKGFDNALSTYIPNSTISKFNSAKAGSFIYYDSLGYFNDCIKLSQSVYEKTRGAFDPSVFTLLEIWGFLKDVNTIPDSLMILETLRYTSFKPNYHYVFQPNSDSTLPSKISKRTPQFKIVFNAIAQGQAVDVLCDYLEEKGAKNYFIEIGGEVRVKGLNDQGKIWTIGIDKPIDKSTAKNRELIHIIELDGKAVATSGNYRQFYKKDGVKYSHTLNPKTGYPVQHHLLSATVVSPSCALADGYATAFMVLGVEETKIFLSENSELNLQVFLIYNNANGEMETYATDGFAEIIKS